MDPVPADETAPVDDELSDLVRRAQAGSEEAAFEFAKRYGPKLLTFIRQLITPALRRSCDSSDLLQDFFVSALCNHFEDKVFATPVHLWAYLFKIARNKVRDANRTYITSQRRAFHNDVSLHDTGNDVLCSIEFSPVAEVLFRELYHEGLMNLKCQLPKGQQRLFKLFLDGHAIHELAKAAKVSQRTVQRTIRFWLSKVEDLPVEVVAAHRRTIKENDYGNEKPRPCEAPAL